MATAQPRMPNLPPLARSCLKKNVSSPPDVLKRVLNLSPEM